MAWQNEYKSFLIRADNLVKGARGQIISEEKKLTNALTLLKDAEALLRRSGNTTKANIIQAQIERIEGIEASEERLRGALKIIDQQLPKLVR